MSIVSLLLRKKKERRTLTFFEKKVRPKNLNFHSMCNYIIAKNSPVRRRTTFSIRNYLLLKIRQCGGAQLSAYAISY